MADMQNNSTKTAIGWLTYLIMCAFSVFLLISMIRSAWFEMPSGRGVMAFFGFGIPLIVGAFGTGALWSKNKDKSLINTLGWTCAVNGCIHGLFLLLFVATSVFGKSDAGIGHYFGFGIPMLVCGGLGIMLLIEGFDE